MADENKSLQEEVGAVQPPVASAELSYWGEHRLALLLVITIAVAAVFMVVGMVLYNVSGAAELDFSRPGLQSASDKVETKDSIDEYSASGAVNKETVDEFTKLFDEQAKKTTAVDAFKGDPLNPEVLYADPSSGSN